MVNVIKENMALVKEQTVNLSREIESVQNNQMEIWDLKIQYVKELILWS